MVTPKHRNVYHLEVEKCINFGECDPIFKVLGGQRMLKNDLLAPYLLKEWIDFEDIACNNYCEKVYN